MSKQPNPPPPGDKPVRTAPPPPPGWRHGLWAIALIAVVLLYIFLPGINIKTPVSLTYSQFTSDVSAHKIKTVVFGNGASGSKTTVTGTLTNGSSYTTPIPRQPSPAFSQQLTADWGKTRRAAAPSCSLSSTIPYCLILM